MMNVEMVAHTIQLILAPVVMVTACGLMLNSLMVRYGAINDRIRGMNRERLDLLRKMSDAQLDRERLTEIDTQTPDLLQRHKQMRDALMLVYMAVLVFIANMFVIASASALQIDGLALLVLSVFLAGIALLFVAVLIVTFEIRYSHRALHFESRRVTSLEPISKLMGKHPERSRRMRT